jgi:hypothetical protein
MMEVFDETRRTVESKGERLMIDVVDSYTGSLMHALGSRRAGRSDPNGLFEGLSPSGVCVCVFAQCVVRFGGVSV